MKRSLFFQFSLILLAVSLLLSGCFHKNQKAKKTTLSKPVVAVAIVPEKTFIEKIAGNDFEIALMIPPGYSPANYEPTPMQMKLFSQAHYYFSMQMPTEKNAILPHLNPKTGLIDLAAIVAQSYPDLTLAAHYHHHDHDDEDHHDAHHHEVDNHDEAEEMHETAHANEEKEEHHHDGEHEDHDEEGELHEGERDPHIWLSPKRAILMVETMAQTLMEIAPSPERAKAYQINAEKYIKEIQKADSEIRYELAKGKTRDFFVFHPAFGYFAQEYALTQHSLEKGGKEATAQHLVAMTKLAKEKNIKAIFCQAEIDSRQTKSFAEGIQGKAYQLDPLSADYPQNLIRMAKQIASTLVE